MEKKRKFFLFLNLLTNSYKFRTEIDKQYSLFTSKSLICCDDC